MNTMKYNILTAEDFDDIEINDEDIAWMEAISDELIFDEIQTQAEITSNIPLLESRAMKFARLIQ